MMYLFKGANRSQFCMQRTFATHSRIPKEKNYYAILGINRDANLHDVQKA